MAKHRLELTFKETGNAALAAGGSCARFGGIARVGGSDIPHGSAARHPDGADPRTEDGSKARAAKNRQDPGRAPGENQDFLQFGSGGEA